MWLEGKRNRRGDHLIHTLAVDMLPYYETRHNSQELGFSGSNLAQKRRTELLARTPEMNADSICAKGGDRYYVKSATESSRSYLVELSKRSCDCPDWPRVQLCKHVTAVAHFFGNGDQLIDSVPTVRAVEPEGPSDVRGNATATSILENVINVSRDFLSDGTPSSPGTVRSLHMVEAHLTAVVQCSRSSESPLPDKEDVPPNQHTWTETAQRMGAQRRKRPRPTTTTSSPEPTATLRIGNLNRKQPRLTDPYSGGVNSGRNAAPDTQSVTKNAEARAAAAANSAEPGPSQPRKRARTDHTRAGAPAPPPSSAHLAWYPMPAHPPAPAYPSAPAPPSAPYLSAPAYPSAPYPSAPAPPFMPYPSAPYPGAPHPSAPYPGAPYPGAPYPFAHYPSAPHSSAPAHPPAQTTPIPYRVPYPYWPNIYHQS